MFKQNTGDSYILIGATSGLGWEFFLQLPQNSSVLLVGRMSSSQFQKQLTNSFVSSEIKNNDRLEYFQTDLSKPEQWSQLQDKIKKFSDQNSNLNLEKKSNSIVKLDSSANSDSKLDSKLDSNVDLNSNSIANSNSNTKSNSSQKTNSQIRIFYFAGGGPHGAYSSKKFSDHMWAMNVSYLAFASILHFVLNQFSNLKHLQIIAIGSSIAESKPDFHAASYSAAKHALKGLISSIQLEYSQPDVRLFSPGYMKTKMLPPMAWVYQLNGLVASPKQVASILSEWSLNSAKQGCNANYNNLLETQ